MSSGEKSESSKGDDTNNDNVCLKMESKIDTNPIDKCKVVNANDARVIKENKNIAEAKESHQIIHTEINKNSEDVNHTDTSKSDRKTKVSNQQNEFVVKTKEGSQTTAVDSLSKTKSTQKVQKLANATSEQLRIAEIIDISEEESIKKKIEKVCQVTGRSNSKAIQALQECHYNVFEAIDLILEGVEHKGKWQPYTNMKKKSVKKNKDEKPKGKEEKPLERSVRSGSRGRANPAASVVTTAPPRTSTRPVKEDATRGRRKETISESSGRDTAAKDHPMVNGVAELPPRASASSTAVSASEGARKTTREGGVSKTRKANAKLKEVAEFKFQEKRKAKRREAGIVDKPKVKGKGKARERPGQKVTESSEVEGQAVEAENSANATNTTTVVPNERTEKPEKMEEEPLSVEKSVTAAPEATPTPEAAPPAEPVKAPEKTKEKPQQPSKSKQSERGSSRSKTSSAPQQQPTVFASFPASRGMGMLGPRGTNVVVTGDAILAPSCRGLRGRGTALLGSRSYQKSRAEGGAEVSKNKSADPGNWDEEKTAATEEWDSEWTGSLDKTTVFGPSTAVGAPLEDSRNVLETSNGPIASLSSLAGLHTVEELEKASQAEARSGAAMVNDGRSHSSSPFKTDGVLSVGPLPSSLIASVADGMQPQTIDLAALLKKAAPNSTLGRMPPVLTLGGGAAMLAGAAVPHSVTLMGANSGVTSDVVASNISIFSNSASNLNNMADSKVLSYSSHSSGMPVAGKNAGRRTTHTSKIPAEAVEMPDIGMDVMDMQFAGLEFGSETLDMTASDMVSASSAATPPPMHAQQATPSIQAPPPTPAALIANASEAVAASVAKDLSAALNSSMAQTQSLPQPIPFPSHSVDRKSQQSALLGGSVSQAQPASQSLADQLAKKETAASLGGLVGPPAAHYQQATNAYGPPKGTFPSPPSHYSQNSAQGFSSNASSGVNSGSSSYGVSFSQVSGGATPYQNSYANASSHSLTSMNASKHLKESSPQTYNESSLNSALSTSSAASSSTGGGAPGLTALSAAPSNSSQQQVKSVAGKSGLGSSSAPPGVHPPTHQQHVMGPPPPSALNQHHQSHLPQHLQATQQQSQMLTGPSQYVSQQQPGLAGALAPPYFNVQQPPQMYSIEDLQVFQQRMPHMPQAQPTATLPGAGRDGITSPPSYSMAEAAKFRADQNSSPVPSTISQQGQATAGATYITTPGNAGMTPIVMYQTMPAMANSFSQYGAPAIIPIPPNSHTGSTSNQFPGPPKMPYQNISTYYDNISQTQDYKSGYGSAAQGGPSKAGPNSSASVSNAASDLGYKTHLGKVNRSYEKPGFHSATTPPFNLPGSGTNAIPSGYPQMFIPTMPPNAQHHSTLVHHQLHQDAGSSVNQRSAAAAAAAQNKGGSKNSYSGSYWTN